MFGQEQPIATYPASIQKNFDFAANHQLAGNQRASLPISPLPIRVLTPMSTKVGRKKTKKNTVAKEATNGAEPTSPSEPTILSSLAKAPVSVAASQTGVSQEQAFTNPNGAKNSDLDTLRRLKDTILNGQHPFFKATPQVAHLQALRVTGQTYSHNGTQAYRAASVPDQDIENVPPHSLYAPYGQHEPSFPIERDDDIHATGQSPSQEVVANDDAPHAPETRDEQMADPSDSVPTGPVLGDSSTADIKPQGGPDRFPERDRYYDGRRSPRADHGAGRDNWEHRQNRPAYSDGRYRDYGGVNRSVSSGGPRRPYQDRLGGPPPNDRDPYPDSRPYDYNRDKRREPLNHADNRRPGEFHNPKRPYDSGRPGYFPPPPPRPELPADDDRRDDLYRRDEPRPAPADAKPLVSAPPTDSVMGTSVSTQEKSQGTEPSATADDVKGDSAAPNPNPEAPPVRSASVDVVRPSFRGSSPGRSDTRDSGRFRGPEMRGPPNRNALRGNVAGSRIDRDYRPHDDMRPPYLPLRDYPEPPPRLDPDPRYPPAIPGGPPYERMAPPHVRDDSRPPYDPRDRDYRDPYSRASYPPQPDDRRYTRDPGPPLPPLMEDSRYPPPPKEFGRPSDIERRRDLDRPERGYDRERGYNNRERDMRPPSLDIRDARGPPPPPLPGALPRSAYVPDRDRDVVSRPPLSARISPRGSDQFAPPPPTPEPRGGYERPGYGGPPPPLGGAFPPRDNPRVRPRSLSPARRDYRPDDRPPMKRPRPDEPYTGRPPPPPAAGYPPPPPASYPPPPPRPHDPSYPPDRRPAPPPAGPPPAEYYNRGPPRY